MSGKLTFSDHWEFYPTQIEGKAYSIRFDAEAGSQKAKEAERYPHTLVIAVLFEEEREDGFPTNGEIERLNGIEDRFCPKDGDHLKLVGVMTGDGCRRFVFCYGGDTGDVDSTVKHLLKKSFHVRYRQNLYENDRLGFYKNILAPNKYDNNYIYNHKVCQSLVQHGDDMQTPRVLDFYCYFPDGETLGRAAVELVSRGYREEKREQREDGQWALSFTMELAPDLNRINELTVEILDLMKDTGGDFDGWGCPVVKGEQ